MRIAILLVPLMAACSTTASDFTPDGAPAGTTIEPSGYATILDAPPSPFPEIAPEDAYQNTLSPVEQFARDNGLSLEEAAAAINGPPELQAELQRLQPLLRANEAETFVDFVMVRDPGVRMEVWFTRNAEETLARYTSNPLFVPRDGGVTPENAQALADIWIERSREYPVIQLIGTSSVGGDVELGIGIEEAEFRALAAQEGWELGPDLTMTFASARPAAFSIPEAEQWVRFFPRENIAPSIRLTAISTGTITLEDGCFRVRVRNGETALALFGYDNQLGVDEQGYLTISRTGEDAIERYRIGEPGAWGGPAEVREDSADVVTLREACGDGEIWNVADPTSLRLFSLPFSDWVTNYAEANDLSRQEAWDIVIACMRREERRGRAGLEARDRCIRQFN
ncbi:hypothetical protein [Aurantiacibacter sediminis]|uniref:Lipoprotein n=1 Tax=Aurantiacibacter sediminis TaxID=2793064 RepID=A0ABS0N6X5_9SPHN|nr:hypothetical protein [Aurantiacibacter sediminis]MBH5323543.1 hypothetical protein [Aurantiacibacter sediminis]